MSIASERMGERWGEIIAGPWSGERVEGFTPEGAEVDAHGLPRGALASIGRALQNVLERYSGTVTRRVVGAADELGIDGIYVAMIVMRQHDVWPTMRAEDRRALEIAGRLMASFAMLPGMGDMQVPGAEVDVLIDRVLADVASWSRVRLVPDLKHEYMALLEEYAERLRPMLDPMLPLAHADPLADRPTITIALMERFEHWLAGSSTLPARRPMLAVLEGLFR